MKKYNILYSLLIFLISCNETQTQITWKRIDIKHQTLNSDIKIGIPEQIFIVDSMILIVSSNVKDGFCKLYSLKDYQEKKSFGSIGRGPYEFNSPRPMIGNEKLNEIRLFDLNGFKTVKFSLEQNEEAVNVSHVEKKVISNDKNAMSPYIFMATYNDSLSVGVCMRDKGEMIGLLDENMNTLKYFGDAPISEETNSNYRFQGIVQVKGDKVIYAPLEFQMLACYTINGLIPEKLWERKYMEMHYSVHNGDIMFSKEKSRGSLRGLSLGEKYIYLAVNDTKKSEFDGRLSDKSHANILYIYDYDGNHIAQLILDQRIEKGCISSDERIFYAIANTPEPALVSFDLPESY